MANDTTTTVDCESCGHAEAEHRYHGDCDWQDGFESCNCPEFIAPDDAVNDHLGMTVREIRLAAYCVCGHDLEAHLPDGLLEADGACEDLGRDRQGCLCRGYRGEADFGDGSDW